MILTNNMAEQKCIPSFISVLLLTFIISCKQLVGKEIIRVGVILDLESNSVVGKMAERCLSMALDDFYIQNSDYRTKLSLLTRDSKNDVVFAASAALDLMKNEQVQAIIGPQRSSQAKFVIDLGSKAQVPIISFSATSPSLSPTRSPYFVRAAQNEASQVKAIASIVQYYGWRELVLIYEDTDYGNGLVPYLLDAFQEVDTKITNRTSIPLPVSDTEIKKQLKQLKENNKRIFLVHMTGSLGSRLFSLANNEGMISEDYGWLVTEGLSNIIDPVSPEVMEHSMQGVLGVRPLVPKSNWKMNFTSNWQDNKSNLSLFGLWAYDTVWALAMAVENAKIVQSSYSKQNFSQNQVDLATLGVSKTGPRLLKSILNTTFLGLSGDFDLRNGELNSSVFEIFNVIGRNEIIIGYWSPESGLVRDFDATKFPNSNSKTQLKQSIWPGPTIHQPKKLRIGVPKRNGFQEFIRVEWPSNMSKISGFSYDVFLAVVDQLPFPLPYEFCPFVNEERQSNGTFSELLQQIKLQKYDAVVGDITIVADRSLYVDFTLPYSESGVSMMVPVKREERENIWIFLKPLSLDLWLTTAIAFIFNGLVVWVLEHRINTEFRGPPEQQIGTTFWFTFSTLFFAHRERVVNNWTKFIVIIWAFVVLIISQSYAASLASMLTVQRLQPTVVDVKEIQRNGYLVGYQTNSFVKDFLKKQLNFNETMLRNYTTVDDYHDALSKGTHNGGVAAIFDEIPYIKLFLAKHCSKFKMVGPTYKTGGFGFAFPLGSPLVSYFSRAILNVTQDKDTMQTIENKYFGPSSCEDQDAKISSDSLSLSSFGGLFIITGVASMSALLIYITKFLHSHEYVFKTNVDQDGSVWLKILELAKKFDEKDTSANHHLKRTESGIHPEISPGSNAGTPPDIDNLQNHSGNTNSAADSLRRIYSLP